MERGDRRPVGALRGHHGGVWCVGLSQDGKYVASGSWHSMVRVWNAETGEPIGALRGNCEALCVALSRDGKRAASGSWDNTCGCGMPRPENR